MLRSTDMYKFLFILSLSVLSTGAFAQSTPDTSAYTSKQFEKIQLLEQQLANLSSTKVCVPIATCCENYSTKKFFGSFCNLEFVCMLQKMLNLFYPGKITTMCT